MRVLVKLALVASLVAMCGCSIFGSDDEKEDKSGVDPNTTEKMVYDNAQRMLRASQWEPAIRNLQLLEENFPFGNYAEQAQLELVYAYYRSYQPDAAIAAADRFIRLHPQHPQVDYAYYLKGLATFNNNGNSFDRFFPTDQSKRDPGASRESFAHFSQLLARFPNSPYAPDARKRMIYLRNMLARAEINVANYYFKRGAYLAAANRGRYVVENFQQTPAVPDGLAVMIQAYKLLGMDELASENLIALHTNYPEYPALMESGQFDYAYGTLQDEKSWVSTVTFGLFDSPVSPSFDTREIYNTIYFEDTQVAQEKYEPQQKERGWLNRISFGLID
ncbi:outer membrane protein assembly factor BamD [Marinibactrum halimedae]|uniref:Outer membrane protein assembly factor BamD n=1 Tax=Marinibactrum halimedae TaxID=1444977 RepID=A0AA37T6W6_9GAMM|nr:outer membrane protein assembly factor BamD [Marinibactrum halimedae]MCD9460238.1 outer membrane protein assembly factor BamD [Marinibactrum halimedae]GLS27929.1 outer membrane protein assembly factor BamD [Marinibactrum halimedae]